jgi:hypothetical protein
MKLMFITQTIEQKIFFSLEVIFGWKLIFTSSFIFTSTKKKKRDVEGKITKINIKPFKSQQRLG